MGCASRFGLATPQYLGPTHYTKLDLMIKKTTVVQCNFVNSYFRSFKIAFYSIN